jgi:hypothetical protein
MSWNSFSAAKIAACNKSLRIAIVSPTPSTKKSRGKRSEPAMERMQLRRLCVIVAARRRVYCRQCGNIKCLACFAKGHLQNSITNSILIFMVGILSR